MQLKMLYGNRKEIFLTRVLSKSLEKFLKEEQTDFHFVFLPILYKHSFRAILTMP